MESSEDRRVSSARAKAARLMPMEVVEEIEEFFAEAESKEMRHFVQKYNYDVAKDAPLEGRYEWVRIKP